jgi:hypothetical protein
MRCPLFGVRTPPYHCHGTLESADATTTMLRSICRDWGLHCSLFSPTKVTLECRFDKNNSPSPAPPRSCFSQVTGDQAINLHSLAVVKRGVNSSVNGFRGAEDRNCRHAVATTTAQPLNFHATISTGPCCTNGVEKEHGFHFKLAVSCTDALWREAGSIRDCGNASYSCTTFVLKPINYGGSVGIPPGNAANGIPAAPSQYPSR